MGIYYFKTTRIKLKLCTEACAILLVLRSKSLDISTQHYGPKQGILIKLYQKELRQLLGYGIYTIMLMILTFN